LHPAVPAINVSQIPAAPNAPANLGNAPKSAGPVITIPQNPASPDAPANLGNAPKSTGPVVTIPQNPASPNAPVKVGGLLPAKPASPGAGGSVPVPGSVLGNPGAGGATPGGMPLPAPMGRTKVNLGPIPLSIGTDVVTEDACYWIKGKFVLPDGEVVRFVKVCEIIDTDQP
jgi:hypothetical protein